jgi:hypothetical protein
LDDSCRSQRVHPIREPGDVGGVEGNAKPGQLDEVLCDGDRSLHGLELSGEDEMVSAEDRPDLEETAELLEVPIVDAGQQELIGTLGAQAMLYDGVTVGHVSSP